MTDANEKTFWDNFVNGVAWRLLGNRKAMEALGLAGPNPLSGKEVDIRPLVKDAEPPQGWGGLAGEIAGTLPMAGIPGGPITQGLAAGALTGATEPTDKPSDRAVK